MGTDLVSACVFCAGLFLGGELSPRPGLGIDVGFSYATLARRYEVVGSDPLRFDSSDVTPKFVLVGVGQARFPSDGLGAGTAAMQWRLRVAFGPSHDEQQRRAASNLVGIETTGSGRFENFELLGRVPITPSDSIEVVGGRRVHNGTDIINIGGSNNAFREGRSVTAGRIDVALGWRHRWRGLELAAAGRWVTPESFIGAEGTFRDTNGSIFGGALEVRGKKGPWTVSVMGERLAGSLSVHEESEPAFAEFDFDADASFTAIRLGIGYAWPRTDLMLSGSYDRQRLPFVSHAILGTETVLFDGGYHPDSTAEQIFGELLFRYALTPGIRLKVGLRLGWGDETVDLTDLVGDGPPVRLDVLRRGVFGGGLSTSIGAPEPTLFIGADFAVAK